MIWTVLTVTSVRGGASVCYDVDGTGYWQNGYLYRAARRTGYRTPEYTFTYHTEMRKS